MAQRQLLVENQATSDPLVQGSRAKSVNARLINCENTMVTSNNFV